MASKQEEKERRRQERMEAERREQTKAKRLRLVQLVVAGILVLAIGTGAVIALVGGGDGGDVDAATPTVPADTESDVAIPEQEEEDLEAAVEAAGCELGTFTSEGQQHVADDEQVEYGTNPPTSGPHYATPAQDGVYEAGNSPQPESWVHTLEHGRIVLQYAPGTEPMRVGQLTALFNEPNQDRPQYHMVLMENTTEMEFAVAAVAWENYVGCPEFNDEIWDAFRAFRDQFTDQAPELVP
jgi:hypothetical protein